MKTTKEKIAVMQAFEDGKRIECSNRLSIGNNDWTFTGLPLWNWNDFDYRVATEPKLRSWKPEEVPVGALIRSKHCPAGRTVILYCWAGFIFDATPAVKGTSKYNTEYALEHFEHSLDHGKTWQPCGVLE